MAHVCGKSQSEGEDRNLESEMKVFTCGCCSAQFSTVCNLHKHLISHNSGGSYHFDHALSVAFPRYESCCKYTQTTADVNETKMLSKFQYMKLFQIWSRRKKQLLKKASKQGTQNVSKAKLKINKACNKTTRKQHGKLISKNSVKPCSVNIERLQPSEYQKHSTLKLGSNENNSEMTEVKKVLITLDEEVPASNSNKTTDDKPNNKAAKRKMLNRKNIKSSSCNAYGKKSYGSKYLVNVKEDVSNETFGKKTSHYSFHQGNDLNQTQKYKPGNIGVQYMDNEAESVNQMITNEDEVLIKGSFNPDELTVPKHEIVQNYIMQFQLEKTGEVTVFVSSERELETSNTVQSSGTWVPDAEWTADMPTATMTKDDETETNIENGSAGLAESQVKGQGKKRVGVPLYVVCEECGKRLRRENIECHLRRHRGETPFVCDTCGSSYTSMKKLGNHKRHNHVDSSLLKSCPHCEMKYPTNARLQDHIRSHTKDFRYGCNQCDKFFYKKQNLDRHTKFVHTMSLAYECSICEKKFKRQKNYLEHFKSHTLSLTCETCGDKFTRWCSLQRHKKIHSGVKPHVCHICKHAFIQKTPFWVHMEKHHDLTKDQLIELFPDKHGDKNLLGGVNCSDADKINREFQN